jgi:hypothetical protein
MPLREIPLGDYFSSLPLEQGEQLTKSILNDPTGHIEKETLIFNAQWALGLSDIGVGDKQKLLRDFLEPSSETS